MIGLREVPQDSITYHSCMLPGLQTCATWKSLCLTRPVGGLRVGATLSVIGAIVGELVGSDRGMGFMINIGRGQYDTALVFVAVITLIIMASSLYALVVLLEKRLLAWQTWRKN